MLKVAEPQGRRSLGPRITAWRRAPTNQKCLVGPRNFSILWNEDSPILNFIGKRHKLLLCLCHYTFGVVLLQHTPTLIHGLKQFTGQESGSPPPGGQGEARERSGPGARTAGKGTKES